MTPAHIQRLVKSETRNWLNRNVIPPVAAANRRRMAEMFPEAAEIHRAYADAWAQITTRQPKKVHTAYMRLVDHATECAKKQETGSELYYYWCDKAATYQNEANKYA